MFSAIGHFGHALRALSRKVPSAFLYLVPTALLLLAASQANAGVIRGRVTDTSGASIKGASIILLNGSKFVSKTSSISDGTFQFVTGQAGRFSLIITADSFRQLDPPVFYAEAHDSVEKNLVMEPEWDRQSIVVTATGTPIAQQQTSSDTSVLSSQDLSRRDDLAAVLRLQPGAVVAQVGERGAQTSLFIRGGDSDAGKTLFDGTNISEIGGVIDFGNISPTGIQSAEVYRGPNSSLYGSDAASGVVDFSTPHGVSASPILTFNGDLGNFDTSRNQLEVAGSKNRLDYYSAYSWAQTANSIPMDQYHVGTAAGNFGYQRSAALQFRGTVRYGVSAVGVPNAYDLYRIADDRKESDQNVYIGGSVDFVPMPDFHNKASYGAARKREQSIQWYPAGICEPVNTCDLAYPDAGNYYGEDVTIRGANGAQVVGQALLNYSVPNFSVYPNQLSLVNNRDELNYEGDYNFTPHLTGLIGFHFENERGIDSLPVYAISESAERNNYNYLAEVHGDFKNRLFYTLGGSLGRYDLVGTQTSPRFGVSYYLFKTRPGKFNGTRLSFNFAEAVREPTLNDQFGSLYSFLEANGGQATVQQFNIRQISAPTARTWEGGIEQGLFGERVVVHLNFFHNEFGRQIESVGVGLIPALLPNLTTEQQKQLEAILTSNYAYDSLDLNSEDFRALGFESTVEYGIGRYFFVRGGYTYLDTVVQHSFSSDNAALLGGYAPTYNGVPIGIYSPLTGGRAFRRPPHTGFITGSYSRKKLTLAATGAFSSRSDDSDFLGYSDINQGNSLLLPNRNLDYGFARIDFGGSFQLLSHIAIYGQAENLTSNQHIAPIGYPSLPFNFRLGLRVRLGKGSTE